MDEVGRGAWAGPVVVGVVVIEHTTGDAPAGINDSKLVASRLRPALAQQVQAWCAEWALGHASATEIDRMGMTRALGLAAWRAMDALTCMPDVVLLDGNVDFVGTFAGAFPAVAAASSAPKVETVIKGDQASAAIAGASIVAKVARDAQMVRLAASAPDYGFATNKGYGTGAHEASIVRHGLSTHHRRSWSFAARIEELAGASGGAQELATKG